jgi:hypothetical protein
MKCLSINLFIVEKQSGSPLEDFFGGKSPWSMLRDLVPQGVRFRINITIGSFRGLELPDCYPELDNLNEHSPAIEIICKTSHVIPAYFIGTRMIH